MDTIFLTGIGLFSLTSLFFLFAETGKKLNTAFLVSVITLVSYILMYEGIFVSLNQDGEAVYYSRWFFYAFSCTLLVYEIARRLKKDWPETTKMIYLTTIVMITGMFAAIFEDEVKAGFFVISTIVYILLLLEILNSSKEVDQEKKNILVYIFLGWCIFPVFFLLGPEGFRFLGNEPVAIAYLTLDLFTKIIFYLQINQKIRIKV